MLIASCLTCLVSRHPWKGWRNTADGEKLWRPPPPPPPLSDRERGKRGGRKLKVVLIEQAVIFVREPVPN